jgi:tetratricopeptide (TPR) repeat protein
MSTEAKTPSSPTLSPPAPDVELSEELTNGADMDDADSEPASVEETPAAKLSSPGLRPPPPTPRRPAPPRVRAAGLQPPVPQPPVPQPPVPLPPPPGQPPQAVAQAPLSPPPPVARATRAPAEPRPSAPPVRPSGPAPAVHRSVPPASPQRRSSRPPPPVAPIDLGLRQPDEEAMAVAMRAVDAATVEVGGEADQSVSPESNSRAGVARALLRFCEQELQQNPEPRRSARLHYEAARLLEVPLWDFGAAVEHYEAARKLWPEHVPTLRGLRRVQTALGRYSTIPSLLDAEIRSTRDPARRALLFYEKGCLHRDYLEDHRGARAAFAAAIELDPGNLSLLKAARLAELQAGGWGNLDKAYELTTTALANDTRQRAAVLVERARLVASKVRDLPLATALYEAALKVDPEVPRAVRELKRLLYGQKRWLDLVNLLSQDAARTEDRESQSLMLYQAGRIQGDRLGNVDAAIPLLERAHAAAPDDATILDELARHYELAGHWEALVSSLERLASKATSPSERLHRLHRLGLIYGDRLGNEELAIQRQRDALSVDPGYSPALQALDTLYRRSESWEDLVQIYLGEANVATTPARQADALLRVAEISEERLHDPGLAVRHYQSVLTISPDSSVAFKALVRLFHDAKDFARMAELYRREIERVSDSETKRTYLFKLGRLEEDDLGVPAHAVATYRRILELEPQHMEAIHAIQRSAERAGLWIELASALETEAAITRDPAALLGLWHRIGEVYERKINDAVAAQSWYRKVIERDDCHIPTQRSLARMYNALGRWDELIEVYKLELKVLPKPHAKAALLFKIGQLCEDALANETEAISNYRKAIQFDGAHLPSLRALQQLLSRRGDWKELVRLVQMEVAALDTPEAQARAKYRVGEIYENRLGAADLALAAYDEALALNPSFQPALDARTRLLELAADHERLSLDLAREAAAAKGLRPTIDALLGRAQVLHDELKSPAQAAQIYEEVLERDGDQIGALLALEHIYAGLGKYQELARIYALEADVFTHPGGRVAALRELGRVQETHRLVEGPEVAKTYLSIVRLAPTDGEVLTTLERLAISQQDWHLVTQVDTQLAQCSEDPAVVAAHQTRLAEALEDTGDSAALDTYRHALAQDPDSISATRGLSRLARRSEDPDLLAEAAEYEARVTRNLEGAAELLALAADKRSDRASAARDLSRALEIHPDHAQAATNLVTLLSAEGQFDQLVQILTHAAQGAREPERRADLRIDIAKIQVQELHDSGAAIASAQRAVKERANYPRALLTLANLYAGVRQWREAVRWLRQALDADPPPALATWAKLELARILTDNLGEASAAVELLESLLSEESHNRDALLQLVHSEVVLGRMDRAATAASTLVDACETDEQRAEAFLQVAKLEARRGDRDAALGGFQQAVALSGLNGNAASEFKSFLMSSAGETGRAQWDLYSAALTEFIGSQSIGAPGMGPVHLELARVLGDQLGDGTQSLNVLRQGIAATEDNDVLRLEMAQRLRLGGQHERAAGEYLLLLGQTPLQPVYWRELSQAYKELGREEQSRLALGPLMALNQANQLEQATYGMRPPRPESAGAGLFDKTAFRAVEAHSADDLPTTELLATLSAGAHKLYPGDLTPYGVSSRDKISARSGHPLRTFAERVAAVFGVEDFDLYVHRAPRRRVDVELTETPSVMVPRQVASVSESLRVFLFARVFASLARKTFAAEKLGVQQLRHLLAGAIRNVEPNHKVDFMDSEELGAEARRVVKAMPWRSRKPMEDAVRAYLAGSQSPLVDWKFRERVTAVRAATILCDDVAGATALLLQVQVDLAAEEAAEPPSEALLASVLGFSVSDTAMQLRRRLNLVLK